MSWQPQPRFDLYTAEEIAAGKVYPNHPWAGEHPEVAWAVDMHDRPSTQPKEIHMPAENSETYRHLGYQEHEVWRDLVNFLIRSGVSVDAAIKNADRFIHATRARAPETADK